MYVPTDLTFGFDAKFYKERYSDLTDFSDDAALDHFVKYGHMEGRSQSNVAAREDLLAQIPCNAPVLEIGPFSDPQVKGPHVLYADFLSTEELRKRAPEHGRNPETCPEIHFVLRDMHLSDIAMRFEAVFSSHCIEHQPDLVKHFQDVAAILRPGGRYFLLIPDKRYCFDHFIPESSFAQIISAHLEGREIHSLRSVIAASAFTTHNDATRHWNGDHGCPKIRQSGYKVVRDAIKVHIRSVQNRQYVDVHAWQFTPVGFQNICDRLFETGLSKLKLSAVSAPARGRIEFCAVMAKV